MMDHSIFVFWRFLTCALPSALQRVEVSVVRMCGVTCRNYNNNTKIVLMFNSPWGYKWLKWSISWLVPSLSVLIRRKRNLFSFPNVTLLLNNSKGEFKYKNERNEEKKKAANIFLGQWHIHVAYHQMWQSRGGKSPRQNNKWFLLP